MSTVTEVNPRLLALTEAGAGVSANFPANLVAARAARQFVTDSVTKSNLPVTLLDAARLVVTELAANAIVHARSPFR
jgi:anti-sigma regulatory factor (Ser/Thr protein kinase)